MTRRTRGRPVVALAAVLAVTIPMIVMASAQAANSTKPYQANVRQTLDTPGSFHITITNDPRAQQTLASANVTPPAGFGLGSVSNIVSTGGAFNVSVNGTTNILEFRAASGGLAKGQSVSADVTVTLPSACHDGLNPAAWHVDARQSNDFSGTPGNFMNLDPASDLTPLGSFIVDPIQTPVPNGASTLDVPQILVNQPAPLRVTALDTCGGPDSDYNAGAFSAKTLDPLRLVDATFAGPTWAGSSPRIGSGSVTPVNVEASDVIVINDAATGISADSNAFDVVEKICAVAGTVCTWTNKRGNITAKSTVPGDSGGTASLGLGFRPLSATCTTPNGDVPSFGDGVQINPLHYTGDFAVILTYAKSLTGSGPASGFNYCISKDNGLHWTYVVRCGTTPVANCVDIRRVTGGALQITLYLKANDPFGGGFG
jgi:hypothetical protein